MTTRIVDKIAVEDCGCYVQRITDTWMGETVTYDQPVFCPEHW